MSNEPSKINLLSAISIVAANMIGVGVFTSLGFQVLGITSVLAILVLWIVGGIVALSGALSYGELSALYPRSGGEYNFLSRIYHPILGFLSGWVSMTLGFAAPIAMISMAFGKYFSNLIEVDPHLLQSMNLKPDIIPMTLAIILLIGVTLVNLAGLKVGSRVQVIFTITNLTLIIGIITFGFISADSSHFVFTSTQDDWAMILSQPFATSLMYVSFAYSGWNSATYIAGDIVNAKVNLPKALLYGTLVVTVLYVLLNFIFLYSTPIPVLAGKMEVAYVAAVSIFGENGAKLIAGIISIGLIASINSMMFIGPRVTEVVGQDYKAFNFLSFKTKNHSPVYAILLQFSIALVLILTSQFENVMTSLVFTLSLFTTLTVLGVLVNRFKNGKKEGLYSTIGYPFTPILFILIEIYMMYQIIMDEGHQKPSFYGILIVLSGVIVYWFVNGRTFSTSKQIKDESFEKISQ